MSTVGSFVLPGIFGSRVFDVAGIRIQNHMDFEIG